MPSSHQRSTCHQRSATGHGVTCRSIALPTIHQWLSRLCRIQDRLFVDDCIVYRNVRTLQELQNDLDKLAYWERRWGMLFHPDKCNILQDTRSRNPFKYSYSLKGQDLEVVSNAKYLGVHLSNKPSWNSHINRTAKKANKTLGFLQRNLRINNSDTKAAAYKTLVDRSQVLHISVEPLCSHMQMENRDCAETSCQVCNPPLP